MHDSDIIRASVSLYSYYVNMCAPTITSSKLIHSMTLLKELLPDLGRPRRNEAFAAATTAVK